MEVPHQDRREESRINVSWATGAGTSNPSGAHLFTPVFSGVRVSQSLVVCACFADRCLSFFFLPLCCLPFDLLIVITSLWYPKTLLIMSSKRFQ
jgi:hypothetical protein